MKWLAVLILALVFVPASANDEIIPSAKAETTDIAVMTERDAKTCDWYDYWSDSKPLNSDSTCKYNDYWSLPKHEYRPQ